MPLASSTLSGSMPAPVLRPVSRRTIGDDVLDTLRKAIIAGAFAPGDHLAEGALARQFAVSRAPVREAMIQLEREGLLVFDRRGAALVKEFTAEDFEEIFSLRLALEPMAARHACQRISDEDVARLTANIEQTRGAGKLLEITLLDVEFHDIIVQVAGHRRLAQCWALVRHQLEFWLARMHSRTEAPLAKTREDTVRSHLLVLAALQSGREARAVRAVTEHIEGWRKQQVFPSQQSQSR